MTKTYLATKQEVITVEQQVQTVQSQISTPATGIDARVTTLENNTGVIVQLRTEVDALDDQVNNVSTGILKQIIDVDTEINEAGVGIKARLDDLEQGGTSTTKFRTHSPSGVYGDGEVVQKNGIVYKANGVIDGSTTPIPLVVGTVPNTWTALDKKDPTTAVLFQKAPDQANIAIDADDNGLLLGATLDNKTTVVEINADRGRLSYGSSGTQDTLGASDLLRLSDVTGAVSNVITSDLTSNIVVVTNSSGKIINSNVTATELSNLSGNTTDSNIVLADADRFVVNDNGTMRQLKAVNVANYVGSKLNVPNHEITMGYEFATTDAWLTVCQTSGLILEVNRSGARIRVKDGTTPTRFNYGTSGNTGVSNNSNTLSGTQVDLPISNTSGAVATYIIGTGPSIGTRGVIVAAMRRVTATQVQISATMHSY